MFWGSAYGNPPPFPSPSPTNGPVSYLEVVQPLKNLFLDKSKPQNFGTNIGDQPSWDQSSLGSILWDQSSGDQSSGDQSSWDQSS